MNQANRELLSETSRKETRNLSSMVQAKTDDFSADVLKRIDETVLNYKKGNISPVIDLSDFQTDGEDSSYFREGNPGLNFNSDKI